MHIDTNRVYRTRDLSRRYGVSPITVWRWRKAGKIPQPQKINDQNIWHPEQVEEADKNILGCLPCNAAVIDGTP
jgi:predicted site-specific integrase-resolvase